MDRPVAVVTGAGSGIGRAVTHRLVLRGFRVYVVGRRPAALEGTVRLFSVEDGDVIPLVADVTDRANLERVLAQVAEVSVLVTSAGICQQARLQDENGDAVWDQVMGVNATGTWNTFRILNSRLTDQARTVVVSSGLGKAGRAGYSAYGASKHAVLGLVRCLALELSPRKITVNGVCPGWVRTEMARSDIEVAAAQSGLPVSQIESRAIAGIPLGRFVEPEEVAAYIDWLTGPESSAITGQACNICGGEIIV